MSGSATGLCASLEPRYSAGTGMKIAVKDIKATPRRLAYTEDVAELNRRLARGVQDFQLPHGVDVDVEYYRAGLDLFFNGSVHGDVAGTCGRCLEEYPFRVDRTFAVVLTPRAAAITEGGELDEEEIARTTYEGEEVDLTPLVSEEVLLALPTRPLCTETCRGLCPSCGTNLNTGACACPARPGTLHALVGGLVSSRPK